MKRFGPFNMLFLQKRKLSLNHFWKYERLLTVLVSKLWFFFVLKVFDENMRNRLRKSADRLNYIALILDWRDVKQNNFYALDIPCYQRFFILLLLFPSLFMAWIADKCIRKLRTHMHIGAFHGNKSYLLIEKYFLNKTAFWGGFFPGWRLLKPVKNAQSCCWPN